MLLGVLVDQVGEVTAARYLVAGRKAELEQDCSSSATLRDGRTLLPGRWIDQSCPARCSKSHTGDLARCSRLAPYDSAPVTRR
ncbi:hypothetical protein KCMC57_up48460 [Kitasatospora sp. CMC57]|uniref:Uncharacterized protein n=1 Tax=Kitasatospora sp. CMC57 TaxID=3231513 RepID=A0AB33K6U8_9ACTN